MSATKKSTSARKPSRDDIIFAPAGYSLSEMMNARKRSNKSQNINRQHRHNDNNKDNQATGTITSPPGAAAKEEDVVIPNKLPLEEEPSPSLLPQQQQQSCDDSSELNEDEDLSSVLSSDTSILSDSSPADDNLDSTVTDEAEEPPDEYRLTSFCNCAKCSFWTHSSGWSVPPDDIAAAITTKLDQTTMKPCTPLLKTSANCTAAADDDTRIITVKYGGLSTVKYKSLNQLLVHSISIPDPVTLIAETHFHPHVLSALKKLKYETSAPIQSYVWPALTRQLNVCYVSGRQSGKTMAYLPYVGSLLMDRERCAALAKFKQPFVVILCNSSQECEEVFDLLSLFTDRSKVALLTYPPVNLHRFKPDVIITIPSILLEVIKARKVTFKSLCCLVLENAHSVLARFGDEVSKLMKVINDMLGHRTNSSNTVQLIMPSEKWSIDLANLIGSLYSMPMICMQNHLEAALYAKIQFKVKLCQSLVKKQFLFDTLKDNYQLCKTVVICDDDDIDDIKFYLKLRNVENISIPNDASKDEIVKYEYEWNAMRAGNFKVLLCTDFIFGTMLNVTNATWLVHYSFPATWTRFIKRFVALLDNYQCPYYTKNEDDNHQSKCECFIIIDEKCNEQIPKMLSLFKRLDQDLVNHFQTFSDSINKKTEFDKLEMNISLCRSLKLFGCCCDDFCPNRHTLDKKIDLSPQLPQTGLIQFRIVEMLDVTRYRIKLLSYLIDGETVTNNNNNNGETIINSSLITLMDAVTDKKPVEFIEIGQFYAYYYKNDRREVINKCELIAINKNNIKVKLLSSGLTITTDKSRLYQFDPDPAVQIMYLANLIPPHNDQNFSAKSFIHARRLLEKFDYKSVTFTGNVCLQLNNTLWLDNVRQTVHIVNNTNIVPFNLIKELKAMNVVVYDQQVENLQKLCKTHGIEVPIAVKADKRRLERAKIIRTVPVIKPQWAHLDDNDVQEVIFCCAISPGEFYVRLAKFDSLLNNLQKEIEISLHKNATKLFNIAPQMGQYCLALDAVDSLYCRALIQHIDPNDTSKATCFFVDHGDEDTINICDLRPIPDRLIQILPFQAIRCNLDGLKPIMSYNQWNEHATEVLYQYAFEPDTNVYRSLFVKNVDEIVDAGTKCRTYSVLLKDGFDANHILINQLLIDCGLAKPIKCINDFSLDFNDAGPEKQRNNGHTNSSSSDKSESDINLDIDDNIKDMELFVDNEAMFLEMFTPIIKSSLSFTQCNKSDLLALKEAGSPTTTNCEKPTSPPASGLSAPVSLNQTLTPLGANTWSQTLQTVKLNIELCSVVDCDVKICRGNRFRFRAQVTGCDKPYSLHFVLYRRVDNLTYNIFGMGVQVVLHKGKEEMWPRLSSSSKPMQHLTYEYGDADVVESTPKRIMQLDLSDIESDEEENIGVEFFSDVDSELDEEFHGSDDDY